MKELLFLLVLLTSGDASDFEPKDHKNWKLLSNDVCGQVPSSRIIGGTNAPMNAYPWIVRIGYQSFFSLDYASFRCGGVLINSRTVLTAAHCVSHSKKFYKVAVVRLGEHDTTTDPDCEGKICADPVVDVRPKEIIIPKDYDSSEIKNDVALIRLDTPVNFTNFVKPICLASGDFYKKNLTGSVAQVAGWGIFNIDLPLSSKKLQEVKLPIVADHVCQKYFSNFNSNQLCIGGDIGKDSCGGDSGGPAMMVNDGSGEPRYYVVGLVSFGNSQCGRTKAPGVYTKVKSYTKWILDNLENTTDAKTLKL